MDAAQKMAEGLARSGIPAKRIHCYGNQIMITAWGEDAARRWASLLAKFARVRAVWESSDENVENRGTVLRPTMHRVWRVAAAIE